MSQNLVAQIEKEISQHRARIADLEAAKGLILKGTTTPAAPKSPARAASPAKKRVRAPARALEVAILEVLKATPSLKNSEIRSALKKSGYPYSMGGPQVSKTLTKMSGAKMVVGAAVGADTKYSLPA